MSIIRTAMVSRFSVRSLVTVVACWIALAALPASRADDFTWNGGNGTWPSAGWTNVATSASPVAGPTGCKQHQLSHDLRRHGHVRRQRHIWLGQHGLIAGDHTGR